MKTILTYTPGPWRIADSSEIHSESGQPVCSIAHEENSNLDSQIANANARLIAAAPDLLNALEIAVVTIKRLAKTDSANGTLNVARAAIVKATA